MISRVDRKPIAVIAGMLVFVVAANDSFARDPSNAALQARARMQKSHSQRGSIGNGYRPWSAWTYQQSAQTHAQALNAYGQKNEQVSPATADEHLTEIKRNLSAAKAEVAKLGSQAAQDAEVQEELKAVEKTLAECQLLCSKMEKTIGDDKVDTAELCSHCSGLEEKLKKVETEHQALMKSLGIESPAAGK